MPPDPAGIAGRPSSRGTSSSRTFHSPSHRSSRRDYQGEDEDVAIQEMPASPIVPAISPSNSDYFARSVKTTAAPLPQTADSITELYPDGSALSTPLTSISSSSFLVDSSASVEHTTLSSIYSNSPPISPSTHPTSRSGPSQINESAGLQLHGIWNTTRDSWSNTNRDTGPPTTFRSTPDLVSGHLVNTPGNPTERATGEVESTSTLYQSPSQSHSTPSLIRVPRTPNGQTPPILGHQQAFNPFQSMRPQSSSSLTGHGQATLWPNIPSRVQGTGAHPNPQPWSNIISSPRNLPPNHRSSSQPFQPQGNLNSNLFGFPTGVQYGIHGNFLGTSIARDALLAYAHRLYNNAFNHHPLGLTPVPHQSQPDSGLPNAHHQQLISLLESIKSQHPRHLPTLLLLSCVQFSIGNYDTCASLCDEILSIDGNYVEAISNLGMVMKVKGAITEAESLWMKAIKLRPTYWDAIDNLLHVLCEPATLPNGVVVPPRYHEAIGVLDHVLNILIRADGLLLVFIPPEHLHRLQNLLYTSGNLRAVIKSDPRAALHDHTRGLELIFRPPGSIEVGDPLHFRDIIIAIVVIGLLANEFPNSPVLTSIANAMDIDPVRFTGNMLDRGVDWLALVHGAGEKLVEVLLNQGKGALPMILLTPEKVSRIPETLFSIFSRILPALCVRASYEHPWVPAAGADDPGATKVTSTILLSIAKGLQSKDLSQGGGAFGPGRPLPRSLSLIIIIYYLAISLNPTPSTYNNMGILFYMVKNSATTINAQGNREVINGFVLAQMYYKKGLSMDPSHPHLLTNYGSLLKDQGRPLEAVRMYKKALEINPDFDVALANIANLVKDSGNIPESVSYYQRALAVSPNFPDVICGFVNAMSSICDWRGGRGSTAKQPMVDDQLNLIFREEGDHAPRGWMGKLETVTKKQLLEGYGVGEGIMRTFGELKEWRGIVQLAFGQDLPDRQRRHWDKVLGRFYGPFNRYEKAVNETGFVIRLIELLNRITQQRWYRDHYVQESGTGVASSKVYRRFSLPGAMEPPPVPSVLPFHTFTYSLETRVLRLVAYRNALKISYDALMAPWLPTTVYQPPPPPTERFNIGYVSSDFNNHPLSHLMLSVFGLHDRSRYKVHVYATSSSDNSYYRHRIEEDAEVFRNVSTQSTQSIVTQINTDNIHVLVNLGGYTKAARNDIFAARPCPIQVSLMGYAGTSAASWCDYIVGDERACPKDTFSPWRVAQRKKNGEEISRLQDGFTMLDLETDMLQEADPESLSEDWAFTEKFLHMPHSYFVTDHRQSFPEDHSGPSIPAEMSWLLEERLRYKLRQEIFPELSSNAVIFACFSQLYKICPAAFAIWLKILKRIPDSILWLLRFPSAGEEHLMRVAVAWAGEEVASRVRFTDVARKDMHIRRCRVADLFLDTFQCNAHTIAADVLWTGTPILTWPLEHSKMCTRVAASIAYATGFGESMVVFSQEAYEERAVSLANSIMYRMEINEEGVYDRRGSGELIELRKNIFLNRNRMPLFDTPRWTRNLEKGFEEIWRRWADSCEPPWTDEEDEGCVTVEDAQSFFLD